MTLFEQYPDPKTCPHPKIEPARIIQANGASLVFMRCVDCDRPVRTKDQPGRWLPHDRIFGNVEDVPVWRDDRMDVPACERCGALGAELHHWAPKAVFDVESDDWPTSWLCRRCHGLWHVRMARASLPHNLEDLAD